MSFLKCTLLLETAGALPALATGAEAQGYRLRLDSQAQRASYRGVTPDSILAAQAVTGSTGGLQTPDGFAVRCPSGSLYCFFFRPGQEIRGGPMVSSADLTLWGVGIRGLSVRLNGRVGVDLGNSDVWPGTEPAVQLIEGYAEYAHPVFTARGGRQLLANRLGTVGFDGGRVDRPDGPARTRGRGLRWPWARARDRTPGDQSGPESAGRLPAAQPSDPRGRRRSAGADR